MKAERTTIPEIVMTTVHSPGVKLTLTTREAQFFMDVLQRIGGRNHTRRSIAADAIAALIEAGVKPNDNVIDVEPGNNSIYFR